MGGSSQCVGTLLATGSHADFLIALLLIDSHAGDRGRYSFTLTDNLTAASRCLACAALFHNPLVSRSRLP
jgi:hypothetical protein